MPPKNVAKIAFLNLFLHFSHLMILQDLAFAIPYYRERQDWGLPFPGYWVRFARLPIGNCSCCIQQDRIFPTSLAICAINKNQALTDYDCGGGRTRAAKQGRLCIWFSSEGATRGSHTERGLSSLIEELATATCWLSQEPWDTSSYLPAIN